MTYTIRALSVETWDDFDRVLAHNNGVWGGCWCLAFHPEGGDRALDPAARRAAKRARVEAGAAHAALVYDGGACVGWCQFGPPAELTRIKHRRAYEAAGDALPDWRITCFFTDKGARGKGVAEAALRGALGLMAEAGGGSVEAMPEEVEDRRAAGPFLWSGEIAMFERAGFARVRQLGKRAWLVRKTVEAGAG